MGFPIIHMSTFCSLCTVTPLLVKMDIVPLSAVLPTLINEYGNSVNVLAALADVDNDWNGSCVMNFAFHVSPLAAFTFLLDLRRIGSCACLRSSLVMKFPSAPESYMTDIAGSFASCRLGIM